MLLNLQDNSTEPEPPLQENTRNDVPQSTTETLVEQASASNIEHNHVKQNRTSSEHIEPNRIEPAQNFEPNRTEPAQNHEPNRTSLRVQT